MDNPNEVEVNTVEQNMAKKGYHRTFTLRELVNNLHMLPNSLRSVVALTIAPLDSGSITGIQTVLRLLQQSDLHQELDLIRALNEWDWESHMPYTDDAILVLVEEILENYRDNYDPHSKKTN